MPRLTERQRGEIMAEFMRTTSRKAERTGAIRKPQLADVIAAADLAVDGFLATAVTQVRAALPADVRGDLTRRHAADILHAVLAARLED